MAKNDVLQGTLGLLILKTLASRGPIHGYGITAHIQRALRPPLQRKPLKWHRRSSILQIRNEKRA